MKIRYIDSVMKDGRCADAIVERVIDFDPNAHTTAESTARAFHAALVKLCREAEPHDTWHGQDPANEMSIWSPGERVDMTENPNVWSVCWESGPFNWAYSTDAGPLSWAGPWSFVMTFKEAA